MYLGAVILLYRHLLVAAAETHLTDGASWNLNISVHDAKRYRNECALAGQQVARILGLISFDGTLTKRCWLIMYANPTESAFNLLTHLQLLGVHSLHCPAAQCYEQSSRRAT